MIGNNFPYFKNVCSLCLSNNFSLTEVADFVCDSCRKVELKIINKNILLLKKLIKKIVVGKKEKIRPTNCSSAHYLVNLAIRRKDIFKPSCCSSCGSSDKKMIYGHHPDYLKPLDVIWLCCSCHIKWHKINGEGLNKL